MDSLGPDGFMGVSTLVCWSIIKLDLVVAFHAFAPRTSMDLGRVLISSRFSKLLKSSFWAWLLTSPVDWNAFGSGCFSQRHVELAAQLGGCRPVPCHFGPAESSPLARGRTRGRGVRGVGAPTVRARNRTYRIVFLGGGSIAVNKPNSRFL